MKIIGFFLGRSKNSLHFCPIKEEQNEIDSMQYVLYDVENFRRVKYCVSLRYNMKDLCLPTGRGLLFFS